MVGEDGRGRWFRHGLRFSFEKLREVEGKGPKKSGDARDRSISRWTDTTRVEFHKFFAKKALSIVELLQRILHTFIYSIFINNVFEITLFGRARNAGMKYRASERNPISGHNRFYPRCPVIEGMV